MGSEMCIRDSPVIQQGNAVQYARVLASQTNSALTYTHRRKQRRADGPVAVVGLEEERNVGGMMFGCSSGTRRSATAGPFPHNTFTPRR